MFSSTQALARRALFGQFGMAATQHDHNTNSRKLNTVNLVRTCEDLKLSAPLALKISGTLRGVVNVYDRKMKFPSDVSPLLVKKVEMNEAWRIKSVPVSAVLPKNLAMFGKVTMVKKQFSTSNYNYQAGYFIMQLDNSEEEPFTNKKKGVKNLKHPKHHQADRVHSFGTNQTEEHLVSRFKRSDVEGDNEEMISHDNVQIPTTPEQVAISNERVDGNPLELHRRVSYIQTGNLCRKVVYFKWERPIFGCIKMNTDASVKNVETIFEVKGAIIFRDSSAKLIRGYYVIFDGSSFNNFDSTLAEIMTVKRGLEKAIQLGFTWVWCEVDNDSVVIQLNKLKPKMASEIEEIAAARFEIEEIRKSSKTEEIAKAIWRLVEEHSIKFQISHIWSEGNGPAHCLVSRSFDHDFEFEDPREISTTFEKKLENDESGMERIRFINGAKKKRKMKKSQ